MSDPLVAVAEWPAVATAGVVAVHDDRAATVGPDRTRYPWASVTKILTALAMWVAVEEGTIGWEDPAGPPGATIAHLLAHASGLAQDDDTVLAPPGRRRIYSNRGFEIAADHLAEKAGMPFADYLHAAVLEPLAMRRTALDGSAASSASGPLVDLLALAAQLLRPTLVSPATVARATTVAFPGLAGVLPGFGRQDPNDWGLGVELRDQKSPHWTGSSNSSGTFGHFGRSGSFLWIDPTWGLALASLADRPFGPWAGPGLAGVVGRGHRGLRPAAVAPVRPYWSLVSTSRNAANARGAQTVPGPPFIMTATPRASATSSSVALRRAAPRAWAAMHPSHSRVTAMARAMSSLNRAGSAPSVITARCMPA